MQKEFVRESVRTRMTGTAVIVFSVVAMGVITIWNSIRKDQTDYEKWINQTHIYHDLEEAPMDHILKAQTLVVEHYNDQSDLDTGTPHISVDDLVTVWFAYILGGWKTLQFINHIPGIYYEVTHNVDKGESYVDQYQKIDNQCYSDDPVTKLREKLSGTARDV